MTPFRPRRVREACLTAAALLVCASTARLAAAPAPAALSDLEVLHAAAQLLDDQRPESALERHGARLEDMARRDPVAARILAYAKFRAGQPEQAFELAQRVLGQDRAAGLWMMADLYSEGQAYPLAVEKYQEALKLNPAADRIRKKLEAFAKAGLDSWNLAARHPLSGGAEMLDYKNAGSQADAMGVPSWIFVHKQGDALDAAYQIVKISSRTETVDVDLEARLALKGAEWVAPGGQVSQPVARNTYVVTLARGSDELTLAYRKAGQLDAEEIGRRLRDDQARLDKIAAAFRSAWQGQRKRDPVAMGRHVAVLVEQMDPWYSGLHYTLGVLYLSLESLAPDTVGGTVALRMASDQLHEASQVLGDWPYLWAHQASLYWRMDAFGLAWEKTNAVLGRNPDHNDSKEIRMMLAATGHGRWDKAPNAFSVRGPNATIQADRYTNLDRKPAAPGVIVNEIELPLLKGGKFIGQLALSSQSVGDKTLYFFDLLAWGKRETLKPYGEARPSDADFLKEAELYVRELVK